METIKTIMKEPLYKKEVIGYKNVETFQYKAFDGTIFFDKTNCEGYERELQRG